MITPAIRTLFCSHKTLFSSSSSKAFPSPPLALEFNTRPRARQKHRTIRFSVSLYYCAGTWFTSNRIRIHKYSAGKSLRDLSRWNMFSACAWSMIQTISGNPMRNNTYINTISAPRMFATLALFRPTILPTAQCPVPSTNVTSEIDEMCSAALSTSRCWSIVEISPSTYRLV